MNTGQPGVQQQSQSRRKQVRAVILALLLLLVTGALLVRRFGELMSSGNRARSGMGQKEGDKSLAPGSKAAARDEGVRKVRARLLGRGREAGSLNQAQPRPSNEELKNDLTHPVNIKKELEAGNEKWLATVVNLEDVFFAREARLDDRHGSEHA